MCKYHIGGGTVLLAIEWVELMIARTAKQPGEFLGCQAEIDDTRLGGHPMQLNRQECEARAWTVCVQCTISDCLRL
jgi:hypothetical protein